MVALIEKGSGHVAGIARIVDDLAPLSAEELRSNVQKHRIPADQLDAAIENGWLRPWVLEDVLRFATPIPYKHTSGGSWVKLAPDEQAQVEAAMAQGTTTVSSIRTGRNPPTKSDVKSNTTVDGNKLSLSVEWDDGAPVVRGPRGRSSMFFSLQVIVAVSALACFLVAAFYFFEGLFEGDLFRWKAFAWLFAAAFLLGLAGGADSN